MSELTHPDSCPRMRDKAAMSTSARLYAFAPRFIYLEHVVFLLLGSLVVFGWFPAIVSIFRYGTVLPSALRAAVFLNTTAVSLLLLYLFVKREMRRVRFILTKELLMRKSSLGIKKIPLAAIRSVALFRFPAGGGLLIVNSSEESIFIPMFLQEICDLTARIERACRNMADACPVPERTWNEIRQISLLSESALRRSSAAFKPLITTSVAMLPATVFIGAIYWDMSIIPLMLWAMSSSAVPLGAYTASDIIIRMHEASGNRGQPKSIGGIDEKRVYAWSGLLFFMLYLIAGIIFKGLVQ